MSSQRPDVSVCIRSTPSLVHVATDFARGLISVQLKILLIRVAAL